MDLEKLLRFQLHLDLKTWIKVTTAMKPTNQELANIKLFFYFYKDNFIRNKLNDQLSYPLQAFKKTKKIITEKRFYDNLKHEFLKKLDNREKFKPIRRKQKTSSNYSNKD